MAPRSIPPPPRFADGTIQPIEEAKFIYNCNCAAGVLTHVVIISAGIAAKT